MMVQITRWDILCHSAVSACRSCTRFCGCRGRWTTRCANSSQTRSLGSMSGESASQSITGTLLAWRNAVQSLVVCTRALSCCRVVTPSVLLRYGKTIGASIDRGKPRRSQVQWKSGAQSRSCNCYRLTPSQIPRPIYQLQLEILSPRRLQTLLLPSPLLRWNLFCKNCVLPLISGPSGVNPNQCRASLAVSLDQNRTFIWSSDFVVWFP